MEELDSHSERKQQSLKVKKIKQIVKLPPSKLNVTVKPTVLWPVGTRQNSITLTAQYQTDTIPMGQ